ncbi:hypothetical protein HYH03_002211 [Edaphochlamys debaryana]|uniref:Uncharacterized protein n=2 Tax=Edaphochlamys debaryana TaxID=47281 RepID=A0A835YLK5_9CHLO|nr:hypothetical protein HYH03_002211 [Edaphochlamys debaryana]|eukprot:KAG2499924.1 hypothetical protein HYH03_002211 [Edaphochlamys debaryana]
MAACLAVLTDPNLLSRILAGEAREDARSVRLLSSGICAAYDAQTQQLWAKDSGQGDIAARELSLRRILAHGCRPAQVIVEVTDSSQADQQQAGLRLLRPFVDVSRTSPLLTREHLADAACLTAGRAPRLLARAFPHLTHLTLWDAEAAGSSLAGVLGLLLGSGNGDQSPVPRRPVLPHLHSLDLGAKSTELMEGLCAALRGATQLRHLKLDMDLEDASSAIEDLASLVGLERLAVGPTFDVEALVKPLTALTSLTLGTYGDLPAVAFQGLTALVELDCTRASLPVSVLCHLSRLTRLALGSFMVDAGARTAPQPLSLPVLELPPSLRECVLANQLPANFSTGINGPERGVHWDVRFVLEAEATQTAVRPPRAVAALCRATSAIAQSMAPTSGFRLRGFGYLDLVPGRRNHALEALARTNPAFLTLASVTLSHEDLETLSRISSLKASGGGGGRKGSPAQGAGN